MAKPDPALAPIERLYSSPDWSARWWTTFPMSSSRT